MAGKVEISTKSERLALQHDRARFFLIGLAVGSLMFGWLAVRATTVLDDVLDTAQQQHAELVGCREKFSMGTVIYDPHAVAADFAISLFSRATPGLVGLMETKPNADARRFFIPAKIQPMVYTPNATVMYAWVDEHGRVEGPFKPAVVGSTSNQQ